MHPRCANTSDGMLFGLRQPYLASCKLGGKRRVTEGLGWSNGCSSICAGRPSGDSLSGRELADVPVVITAVAEVSRAIRPAIKLQQHLIKNHLITCSVIHINRLKGQENGSAEIAQHSCANKLFSKPTALMLPSVLCVKLQFLFFFFLEQTGFLPNVFKAMSHRPAEFRAFFAYYNAIMNKDTGKPSNHLKTSLPGADAKSC